MKRSIVSDLYPVSGSMSIYLALTGSGGAWSNTRQVELRFHNSVNGRTMPSAALDLVELQCLICDALSLMRSQYLNPLIDRWVQEKASMEKLCPGTVGWGLRTRLESIPLCLCFPYAQVLQICRTLASEKLAFLE